MRIAAPIAATIALLVSVDAQAAGLSLRYADGSEAPALQTWVDESRVPMAPGLVVIHAAHCASGSSCTTAPGDHIWLRDDAEFLRPTLTHELGHRFDYRVMTARSRAAFKRMIGDRRPWRSAPNSPHEKFAEAYGLCARRQAIRRALSLGYGHRTTPALHRRACRLIRRTAAGAFG